MKKLLLLVVLLLAGGPAWAALIEGRVVLGEKPLAGMQVIAYADLNPRGEKLAGPVTTDAEGYFRLEVPAGYAALYATSDDGGYFAFCGRNPLLVAAGKIQWAGLQAVRAYPAEKVPYDDEYSAGLEGVLSFSGKPLAGGFVSLYLDAAEDLKGQGYRISMPTGEDGFFAFDGLPESDYFLVARWRANGNRVGPLAVGDRLGVYAGNPLALKAGRLSRVRLELAARQPGEQEAALPDRGGDYLLQGRIVDEQGRPLAGLHAFAYHDQMIGHQRPAALSTPSDAEGRFEIRFREAGRYYIGAREAYGDSPAPGELFGLYEGNADHSFDVVRGAEPILIPVAPIRIE